MRVVRVYLGARRRKPKPGFNDWFEADCSTTIELDLEDLEPEKFHLIMTNMWGWVLKQLATQLGVVMGDKAKEELALKAYLGLPAEIQEMIRAAKPLDDVELDPKVVEELRVLIATEEV